MSRLTDVGSPPHRPTLPHLPVVDWNRVGGQAPKRIPIDYKGPQAPLPEADIVVMTWTSAEWSALDHVFLNSDSERSRWARTWEKDWHLYSRDAPRSSFGTLWGSYKMVRIQGATKTHTVLLFKAGAHLAHPPWIAGLMTMVDQVLEDTGAGFIYSIGTAGGARESERLGDVAIVNAAHLELRNKDNKGVDFNDQTFTNTDFDPKTALLADVEAKLLYPLSNAATQGELAYLFYQLQKEQKKPVDLTLDDLINQALAPGELRSARASLIDDVPLLTTDFYFIAQGDNAGQYSVLEMDDAVIAHQAEKAGVGYAFLRNISDSIVPDATEGGESIPDPQREDWSSLIYESFGLYTSMNGALATWALLAGN